MRDQGRSAGRPWLRLNRRGDAGRQRLRLDRHTDRHGNARRQWLRLDRHCDAGRQDLSLVSIDRLAHIQTLRRSSERVKQWRPCFQGWGSSSLSRVGGYPRRREDVPGVIHDEAKEESVHRGVRADAVRLVKAGGRGIGRVVKDLDLTENALLEWVKREEQDRAQHHVALTALGGWCFLSSRAQDIASGCSAEPQVLGVAIEKRQTPRSVSGRGTGSTVVIGGGLSQLVVAGQGVRAHDEGG